MKWKAPAANRMSLAGTKRRATRLLRLFRAEPKDRNEAFADDRAAAWIPQGIETEEIQPRGPGRGHGHRAADGGEYGTNWQQLGQFDTKSSSWPRTPAAIREPGGAIFGDRRFNWVCVYHNGAESYTMAAGGVPRLAGGASLSGSWPSCPAVSGCESNWPRASGSHFNRHRGERPPRRSCPAEPQTEERTPTTKFRTDAWPK